MHGPLNVQNAFTFTLSGSWVSVSKNRIHIINTYDSSRNNYLRQMFGDCVEDKNEDLQVRKVLPKTPWFGAMERRQSALHPHTVRLSVE